MLSRSASLLQARSCGVLIWDRDKNVLTAMRPFAGLEDVNVGQLEFPVGGSAMGLAVLQDRPVILDQSVNGHIDTELLKQLNIQNGVSVPLALERRDENNEVVERSIMGVFCAFDKYYGRPFDMEDARLLSMMARQVSAVLVTSQLYWKEVERTKRISAVLESTSVGIMAVSNKGTVTQVNAAARSALGVPDEGWFGRRYDELTDNREICDLIESALVGDPPDRPRELTLQVYNQDGDREERIYRIQVDQIRSEDGLSLGWVTVFENVTDIRQAERMMAVFVDMMSHELRTPLTSIRGFVATLLQAGEGIFDWSTQEEFLQIVDTEAERLGGMIDDHLNIARIQNGRGLQFNYIPTDLHAIAKQVVRLQSQSSAMKGQHQLVVDIPEDFPTFPCDDQKVTQILHNLVSNALKYSPNGGEVRILARRQGDGVMIAVKDQGLGIPKEQLPKMFSQFFRVEGQSHQGIKGTGLGMWLTKHMVEGHHGRIWVESEFGHGSTFCFWLPLDPNNPPSASEADQKTE
jgi:two-component system phosphate regulon sensor histidine kinase PhoR